MAKTLLPPDYTIYDDKDFGKKWEVKLFDQ